MKTEHTIDFEANVDNENHTEEQYNHDNNDINDNRDMDPGTDNESKSNNTSVLNQSDQLPEEDGNSNDDDSTSAVNIEDTDTNELEDPYAQNITIDDINIVTEMNTSQLATQQEEQDQPPTHGYNLRPRPTKQKEQMSLAITGVHAKSGGQYLTIHPKVHAHVILTQMNINQGLLTFGEKGSQAISKELKQLHDKGAITPIQRSDMTTEERKKALRYLMFLKEKRDRTIKARGCADGQPQVQYTRKEEVSSPTVSLEAMMLLCAIDAKEGRYVIVTDIPGAFLHADMEDEVHMILEGTIAKLIVKLDPSMYRKYIWHSQKGRPMLYVQLKKALYGTLQAALLFWKILSSTLQEWGFTINRYDQCVANKIINGRQCTIIWHVDELKISHVDKKVVEDVLKRLTEKFGQDSPLTTCRGKILDYLGMKIDYRRKGKVMFYMENYIKQLLEEASYDMTGTAKTPAACHLFNTNDRAIKLDEKKAQLFHHMVAKLLYLCRRTRQDIQMAIAFLCNRVKSPDEDDYKKLTRVIQYLRDTTKLTLTIEPDDNPCWWVDSSYAVHPDMKSHTGIFMSIGKRGGYTASRKQKLNTKSSTEAELVAIDDAMGQILWTRHLLADQGISVPVTTIYQDNKSTILLSENGKASSSKCTKHLDARYYFVTDCIKCGEVKVAYCPTENM